MNTKKIRSDRDQKKLRKKIEMLYESPEKVKYSPPASTLTKSIQAKKILIRYYMDTMQTRRVSIHESQKVCGFCQTRETSLWRRIGDIVVCNACGLYYRIHGKIREKTITRGRKAKNLSEDKIKDLEEDLENEE
ncbi:hypothetical protein NEAUS04_2348 [Nematocida ausubeli]|uniref:GATA-type domain-containing protein n=1 Tax=Nematocida ausubeli (strain ATCC PRA-371 / ERTm2) TaxID=1913371 RepID=H8ZAN7_NEMA1|nr:uncharacterized protein NESG_01513 [Nematocida ausubeli]EHY65940.1 hypothetical protein NERG_00636 [Nematocida ausubeli]KAI5133957.1 hypothetical protein NEAUS07_0653 [Nematocida ausubeli]KAI5134698.1 hypothetical protein NEAUS06_1257 [Nematocida ausubeli]KAI5146949.1 hypothetical protein NEAUS05_0285 [Nematocida ausubeli]KAI5164896.1 hypothetical protein NEAUS04_2348 [Nematocida ausubeli]